MWLLPGSIVVKSCGDRIRWEWLENTTMGELLRATPALSEGVMYARSSQSVFAIGQKP